MRRQIQGILLLTLLVTLTLLPPLLGVFPTAPALVNASPQTPGPNDLNATTPLISYEEWTVANPSGNSSLLNVVVTLVNASDIGECTNSDLTVHTFSVLFTSNSSVVFTDNLEYNPLFGWTVQNYSLLQWNLKPETYKVRAYFERFTGTETWNTTTADSKSFLYKHRTTIAVPDYTYIADTSDTIDVFVEYIASSIWGILTEANTTLVFQPLENTSATETFVNVLQYNVSSTYWETYELNISVLIPDQSYKIICSANYSVVPPFHEGISPTSDSFTFRGPYLRVAQPRIIYVGRDVQTLNITVDWVWHSIFGFLNDTEVSLSNFSIFLATGSGGALINETLNWNSTGENWYFSLLNVSYYVELGNLSIGQYYNVSAFFISPERSGRPAVQNDSPFSEPFVIDFDPPSIDDIKIDPSSPKDYQWVIITGELSDDALIDTVILSYYNGSQWINMTMLGTMGSHANFTASIPPFPERQIVEYRIYVNDTQNAWNTSSNQYTVADTLPVISFITHLPLNPSDIDPVTINATITDGTGVQTVFLQYTFDGIFWATLEMVNLGDDVYQVILPRYPQQLSSNEFKSVVFFIQASDVFDNTRVSANLAYQVQGTIPGLDPATSLLILAVIGLAGVALIILYKIYERY